MDKIRQRLSCMLTEASLKADLGFSRQCLGVYDSPISDEPIDVDDLKLTHDAWAIAISKGYVAPQPGNSKRPLVLTPAGQALIA